MSPNDVTAISFDHNPTRYNSIGHGYASCRREDSVVYQRIQRALGNAKTVVNVGAGAGSYEPRDRQVLAVEPSETMILQRSPASLPAIKASAEKLPLHDRSVDAAMAVLSLQHWDPHQMVGIREMRRVARDRVVIVTIDPRVSGQMWLMADYLHEVAELDNRIFSFPETICEWLDCATEIEVIPVSRDTPDWTLLSFWAHPERVLDPAARGATSGFARQPDEVVKRVVTAVSGDLANGSWDARYGHLRRAANFDAGLRIITANLKEKRGAN